METINSDVVLLKSRYGDLSLCIITIRETTTPQVFIEHWLQSSNAFQTSWSAFDPEASSCRLKCCYRNVQLAVNFLGNLSSTEDAMWMRYSSWRQCQMWLNNSSKVNSRPVRSPWNLRLFHLWFQLFFYLCFHFLCSGTHKKDIDFESKHQHTALHKSNTTDSHLRYHEIHPSRSFHSLQHPPCQWGCRTCTPISRAYLSWTALYHSDWMLSRRHLWLFCMHNPIIQNSQTHHIDLPFI